MTTPHTLESLLTLTKSPEGLEQLRIIAAQFDGWTDLKWRGVEESRSLYGKPILRPGGIIVPNYHTSLDAIFAAEERLGLHKQGFLQNFWIEQAGRMIGKVWWENQVAFLTPAQRTIIFILTAQWKEQNQ